MLAFPSVIIADVVLRRGGLATDSIGSAAIRVFGLTAIVTAGFAYVTVRGAESRRPFLLGTVLMLTVAFFCARAALPTGGFFSPYAFGVVPTLLTWSLLMPGGIRWALVPVFGGFLLYTGTLLVGLRGNLAVAPVVAVSIFQLVGTVAGLVCAEVVETWRRRLAIASTTDSLTGVMSRAYIFDRLVEIAARRRRDPAPFSVVMIDLDRFKDVNDKHGHAAGDVVLRTVAGIARAVIRGTDLCGRYGGEEFVLVLDGCDRAQAQHVAERLRVRVEQTPIVARGAKIHMTLSAGVVCAEPGSSPSPEALLRAADAALYESKNAGRNRTTLTEVSQEDVG